MYASALSFAGLYTFPNPLANIPVGGALQANNLVANKDGEAESRRGLAQFANNLEEVVSGPVLIDQIFSWAESLDSYMTLLTGICGKKHSLAETHYSTLSVLFHGLLPQMLSESMVKKQTRTFTSLHLKAFTK